MSDENINIKVTIPIYGVIENTQEGVDMYCMLSKRLVVYLITNVLATYLAMPACNITTVNIAIRTCWILWNMYHLYLLEGLDKYKSAKFIRYSILFCTGSDFVEIVLRYFRDSYFVVYCSHDFYHFQHATFMLFPLILSLINCVLLKFELMGVTRLRDINEKSK
jgi:hypothetical protein